MGVRVSYEKERNKLAAKAAHDDIGEPDCRNSRTETYYFIDVFNQGFDAAINLVREREVEPR